jgi:hypothetical protein
MPWRVVYYRTADGRVPADEILDRCPDKVEATILAVLEAVRRAPPPAFSGGGKWEAMHGTIGWEGVLGGRLPSPRSQPRRRLPQHAATADRYLTHEMAPTSI